MSDELGLEILRSLRRVLQAVSKRSREVGRETGLAVPALLCLQAIASAPSPAVATLAWVAGQVQLSKSTTSTLIERLVKRGLVSRQRSEQDRRRVELSLTALGHSRLEEMPQPLERTFLQRLDRLAAPEQAQILASLESVVELLGAEELEAAPMLVPGPDFRS